MAEPEMTVAEFGKRLGIPRSTAYLAVKLGHITVTNISTSPLRKRLRITEMAYQAYLAKREIKGSRA